MTTNTQNRQLSRAVKVALLASSGSLLTLGNPVLAQDDVTEEVLVTGSRIPRADIDSASPVTILNRADIEASGLTDVGNIIQKMPSMSGSPIGTTTNNGGNGSVQIDLRGMGPSRTLTLVNGNRVVDGGDYQTIPSTMIERVEILKDGASAVYGADAVAGVVNIITRRDFEGIQVSAQTADFFDMKSGAQSTISAIAGKQFDGGNFVFGAEFVDQEEAFQADAPWAFFSDSYYIYPLGCEAQLTAPYDGTGNPATSGCYTAGSSRIPESRLSFFSQGTFLVGTPASAPYQAGAIIPHDGRNYNYAPVNYIQTPYERTNMFAEGHFDLTENVRFNAEIRGNLRTSEQYLAPLPFTGGDPMHNGIFMGTPYTGVSENNYYLRQAVDLYNATPAGIATPLVYEPLVTPRRRMIETTRRFEQDVTQYQWTTSLEGSFNDDLNWNMSYDEGYRSRIDHDFGQFSGERLGFALGPSADLDMDGQPECYTDTSDATTLVVGCVPLNLFGGGSVVRNTGAVTASSLTQDMINYVKLDTVDTFISNQQIMSAGLNGFALDLPAGKLGWAAGLARWKQDFAYTPDSAKTIGAVTGNVGAGTDGSLTNKSLFVEVFAPVADQVDLKAGIRYDDWNAFDNDTTYQFGVEYAPMDNLKLRATAGTVFRAPTISNLFGGLVDSFPTATDPCVAGNGGSFNCPSGGAAFIDNQIKASVGGNPTLVPETGDTFTAGVVYTPEIGSGDLTLTLDYWQVQIEDGISSLGVQFILDDCHVNNNATACGLISRNPNNGGISNVLDGSLNVAEQGAKGIDLEARYNFTTNVGDWEASFLMSHLNERTKIPFAGAPEEDLSGRYSDPTAQDGGAYADDKINMSLQWTKGGASIGYLGEYISELDAIAVFDSTYNYKVDSQFYHDLVGNYDFNQGTRVSMGITNVTDEAPPFIDQGFSAKTDPPTYRLFGRGYYVRLTHAFE